MTRRVLVINGPNAGDLEQIRRSCDATCQQLGLDLEILQTSDLDEITSNLSGASNDDIVLVNPGSTGRVATVGSHGNYQNAITSAINAGQSVAEIYPENIFSNPDETLQSPITPFGFISGLGASGFAQAIAAISDPKALSIDQKSGKKMMLINGPNLNLLGTREPEIYGRETLADIETICTQIVQSHGAEIECFQSNHEGEIVEFIQGARNNADSILINPAAYTHTSIAIHDALRIYDGKIIELHISNPHAREKFRHRSFVSPVADGVISGFGVPGYTMAVRAALSLI